MKKSICMWIMIVLLGVFILPVSSASASQHIEPLMQGSFPRDIVTSNITINTPAGVGPDFDFRVTVDIDNVTGLNAAQYDIWFDASVLRLDNVSNGLINGMQFPASSNIIGTGHYRVVSYLGTGMVSGSGYLAVLHFHAVGNVNGYSDIYFSDGLLSNIDENEIPVVWVGDRVTIIDIKKGDANLDGAVNILDITRVARIILLLETSTITADVNVDGQVNVLDMVEIAKIILSPVSVTPQAWTEQTIPDTALKQLAPGTDVSFITVASNGDIFAVDTSATTDILYKSTGGGFNWSATIPATQASAPWGTGDVIAVAVSPMYVFDNTVFVLANIPNGGSPVSQVYISLNGGTSFAVLGGAIFSRGTSIAIAPNYAAGFGEIMVGTSTGAYIWFRNGVQDWINTNLTSNGGALRVAYSPNFPLDGTRLAVTNDSTAGTRLQTLVGNDAAWDANAQLLNPVVLSTSANLATFAAVAIPGDFNAQSTSTRNVYVGLTTPGSDNVSRAALGSANVTMLTNPPDALFDFEVQSLATSGTTAGGALFAGNHNSARVYRCDDPWAASAPTSFSLGLAGPTGTHGTYIALAPDFPTSNRVYAGTSGPDSALSVSDDGGTRFYQNGLIDNVIARILDFKAAGPTEYWMATSDNGPLNESVWKSVNSGASWKKVLAAVAGSNNGSICVSPEYAADNTVLFAVYNQTTSALYTTNDGGDSWLPYSSPIPVGAVAVKDRFTVYVGSSVDGRVQSTSNGFFFWQPVPPTVFTTGYVADLRYDTTTGYLIAVSSLGEIAISTDGNLSWTLLPSLPAISGNVEISFSGLGNSDYIYAASTAPGTNIYRWRVGVSAAWANITPGGLAPAYGIYGLALNSGSLFALGSNGVDESVLWWTSDPLAASPVWNSLPGLGMVFDMTHALKASAGKLWAIDTLSDRVFYSNLQ